MKIASVWHLPWVVVICLVLGACSDNTLGPRFEPEISNKTDNFQFQATGLTRVSQALHYTWQNTGTMANINQASSISSGSAILTIKDGAGTEVYRKDLNENGTVITGEGAAGGWTIIVDLSKVNGTINFRAQKRTP
ncbi:hypothetical protein ACFL2Z_04770 [Candidatus Eisenbacteria bacterium]|uniref:SusE outer membrane protein domain-containing protein n=1 Tax=Eiseniibacteriota bacterium TaxID=2212470 RepID=A0ABV6YQJ8_UNCEI